MTTDSFVTASQRAYCCLDQARKPCVYTTQLFSDVLIAVWYCTRAVQPVQQVVTSVVAICQGLPSDLAT